MKRNLFAIFLALALVVALAFVIAPTAKAADEPVITYADLVNSENSEDYEDYYDYYNKVIINGDFVLDLQGQDVTVNVADGVTLSVIDSANKGTTGENAGSLTNTGAGSVVAYEGNYQGIRFLKVVTNTETDDNDKIISKTYTFHPCFVGIDMIGVNTSKSALCLKVTYMTNKAAQGYIGETGIMYGADPENLTSAADTFGAFSFEGTVMTAYFDLIGSLDNETAIGESRVFKAYFKSDDQVVANLPIKISPKDVLSDLNNDISVFSLEQREKMVGMIAKNSVLEKYCDNFFSKGYKLVTDAADLAVGNKIVIAAADYNYALSINQNSNNRAQIAITKDGNNLKINGDVQIITLEKGAKDDTFAFYTGSGYLYAASSSANHLKTQTKLDENGSWSIIVADDGVAKIQANGSYTRNILMYNTSSSIFSCYSGNQADVVIFKQILIPACVEHTADEATCLKPSVCTICGKEMGEKLAHFDSDKDDDHICDNGCSEKLDNCTFNDEHVCNCGNTTECVNNGEGKCKYCEAVMEGATQTTTVTLKYTGSSTTNMGTGNEASKVNLDASIFTVIGDKNGHGTNVGLNKDGTIRMYSTSGKNNKLTVSVADGHTILSIKITFNTAKKTEVYDANNDFIQSISASGTVDINSSAFTLINISGAQSRITSIEITYN